MASWIGDDPRRMTSTTLLFTGFALVAGAVVALQPGINGVLSKRLDHPIQASVISFTVGWLALIGTCLALGQRLPRPSMAAGAPWWLFIGGGLVGSFFVTTALIVAPKIGASIWLALVVAGQMVASLLLDHFALLGFPKAEISWVRVLGAVLVVGGVGLLSVK